MAYEHHVQENFMNGKKSFVRFLFIQMILNTVLFCAGQRGNNEGAEEWGGARQVCLRLRLLQPHRGG